MQPVVKFSIFCTEIISQFGWCGHSKVHCDWQRNLQSSNNDDDGFEDIVDSVLDSVNHEDP